MYSPLLNKQIRLLKIHPGKPEDPLETDLLTVNLLEAPPFEALSYVWGNRASPGYILINGYPQWVSGGASDAIHTLRKPDSERLLWVDAVCIDQNDNQEKSHQVLLMGDIYQSAKVVVVHLGHPTERTAEGMRILRSFTSDSFEEHPVWSNMPLPEVEQYLADILNRAWFTRIWTVQEAVLAQHTTLVCGEHEVSWHGDFHTMRTMLFRLKSAIISPTFSMTWEYVSVLDWHPFLKVLEAQMRQAARREGVTIHRNHLDLAFDFRDRRCADPRDKYYAILGIIENEKGGQLKFGPHYDLSFEEVYRQFLHAIRNDMEKDRTSD